MNVGGYDTPTNSYDYDDSYFLNKIQYKNILFSSSSLYTSDGNFPIMNFNGVSSEVKLNHDPKFNFNPQDKFSIEFWVDVKNTDLSDEVHLVGKSTTKNSTTTSLTNTPSEPSYPFEIYVKNDKVGTPTLYFRQSDINKTQRIFTNITTGSLQHVVCEISSPDVRIYLNSTQKAIASFNEFKITQNNANIYIGNKGGESNHLSGSISQLKIYNKFLTPIQITNHYKSSNGSPYIGNVFYPNGLATITHPDHSPILSRNLKGGIG